MKQEKRKTLKWKRAAAICLIAGAVGITGSAGWAGETGGMLVRPDQAVAESESAASAETMDREVLENDIPHCLIPYQLTNWELWENDPTASFSMMGMDYYVGFTPKTYDGFYQALFNLDGNFSRVTLDVGHVDEARGSEAKLYIYMDGVLADTLDLSGDMITQKLELNTEGVRQLRFDQEGYDAGYGYGNIYGYGGHVFHREMSQMVSVMNDGMYTYTCDDCGYTCEEVIPKQEECIPYLTPYQMDHMRAVETSEDTMDCFWVMGKQYYYGVIPTTYDSNKDALYNLGQQYSSVTFTVGHQDNTRLADSILQIFADGKLMKEVSLSSDMMNETITLNTLGVTQLKLVFTEYDSNYAVFDMKYESLVPKEHSFVREVILEAAVGQPGICTYTCGNCGVSYTESIPALTE